MSHPSKIEFTNEDEVMRRAMAEIEKPQSERGQAGHRRPCECIACRERRRIRRLKHEEKQTR